MTALRTINVNYKHVTALLKIQKNVFHNISLPVFAILNSDITSVYGSDFFLYKHGRKLQISGILNMRNYNLETCRMHHKCI